MYQGIVTSPLDHRHDGKVACQDGDEVEGFSLLSKNAAVEKGLKPSLQPVGKVHSFQFFKFILKLFMN